MAHPLSSASFADKMDPPTFGEIKTVYSAALIIQKKKFTVHHLLPKRV
jgi:hypothetical protein